VNNGGILGFKWLEDPTIHGLGCGDNSCKYVKPSGMATNGGCRCAQNNSRNVERFLLRNIAKLHQQVQLQQADKEIDKLLERK
jgi:hypothetical protein